MSQKDIILSIDVVEPGLVRAVQLFSKELGRPLQGIVLVHKGFVDYPARPIDTTGLFKEMVVDFDDQDELQRVVKPFADRILAITTRYEDAIHHFSQLVPFLPYSNTPTESSLVWSTEKPLMRNRLRAYDESLVPRYQYIEEDDLPTYKKRIKDFEFPVIVKPGSLWSSFLVTQCNDATELDACLKSTFQVIDEVYNRVNRTTKPGLLIEEMMVGDMYSTDIYVSQDGTIECLPLVRVLTADAVGLPGFYGYRCIVPTGLSHEETEKGFAAARASVQALNLRSTTAHIEMFHTKDGWKIIELGARIGGYREGLYRAAYGVEHHMNDLMNRAGMKPKMPTKAIAHARAENIFADAEGEIEAIEGLEEVSKLESVLWVEAHAKSGDKALFADKGGDLIVDAMLCNKDVEQLENDVDKLRRLIRIKIKGQTPSKASVQPVSSRKTSTAKNRHAHAK